MCRIIITGAAGRMGRMLILAIAEDKETKLCGAAEIPGSPYIGKDTGEITGIGKTGVQIAASLKDIIENGDVILDFTSIQGVADNLDVALKNNKAMVIGTTGLPDDLTLKIRKASEKIPIVLSPNLSVGVNLLFKIVSEAMKVLKNGYDIEIIEAHHKLKKDAPSGTAKKLFEIIAGELNVDPAKAGVYGRKGITGERKPGEIGIHAVRAGDIVGDHTVLFAGAGENIEFKHSATSRMTFAKGAVLAAKFLNKKKNGLFNMSDVLGL